MLPTKIIQGAQRLIQERIISRVLSGSWHPGAARAPWPVRLANSVPLLQRIPARLIGLGFRREHIRSPNAFPALKS